MEKVVSIIIPTYLRTGEKLEQALQSVFNQTYKNLEVIVVDDNNDKKYSEDITRTLKKYPEVMYISHGINKGACAARNTGILNANGDFIAFLDDDDTWEPEKIEKQIEKFRDPRVGLVYCGIKYYYEKKNKTVYKFAKKSNQPCKDLLIKNFIGSTSCGVVRKSCAIDVGMFDTNLKSGQDLDFWFRIAEKYEIDFVKECLLNYTVYNNGTITSNFHNRLESNIYLKKKYAEIIFKDKELLTVYNLKITKAYLKLKQNTNAIKYFFTILFKREISLFYLLKYLFKFQ